MKHMLLFQAPVAAEKWDGIYNATVSNKICMQNKKLSGYIETEDCLYLNVYTPQVSLYPIIINYLINMQ